MTKARSLSDFIESDGSVTLVDNQKIKVGTGNDLEIYHNGSASEIKENGDGNLKIYGSNIEILSSTGEDMISANADSFVRLYFDNSLKLATTSTGIDVTGNSDVSGELYVGNNNSIFAENVVRFKSSGTAYIDHNTVDADIVFRTSDASALDTTALTLDGSDGGTAIFGGWQKMADNNRIVFGGGSDAAIFSDGTNGYMRGFAALQNNAGGQDYISFVDGGATSLFYNNAAKLATSSSGISVTGNVDVGGNIALTNSNNKSIRINSSTSNAGYLAAYQDQAIFSINRDGKDGGFADTGKAAAVVKLNSASADSSISFQTTTTNNAEPIERMKVTADGDFNHPQEERFIADNGILRFHKSVSIGNSLTDVVTWTKSSYSHFIMGDLKLMLVDAGSPWGVYYRSYQIAGRASTHQAGNSMGVVYNQEQNTANLDYTPAFVIVDTRTSGQTGGTWKVQMSTQNNGTASVKVIFHGYGAGGNWS